MKNAYMPIFIYGCSLYVSNSRGISIWAGVSSHLYAVSALLSFGGISLTVLSNIIRTSLKSIDTLTLQNSISNRGKRIQLIFYDIEKQKVCALYCKVKLYMHGSLHGLALWSCCFITNCFSCFEIVNKSWKNILTWLIDHIDSWVKTVLK